MVKTETRDPTAIDGVAANVGDELGVAEGVLESADPVAMRSLHYALVRAAWRPQATVPAFARFGVRCVAGGLDVEGWALGSRLVDPVAVEAETRVFGIRRGRSTPGFACCSGGTSRPRSCCSNWWKPAISMT